MNDNIISNFIEVEVQEDDFLKVKETLTRIGIPSKKDQTLYQSCHILHKQGRYYIVHFKELFGLDGKPSNIVDTDIARRNAIAKLLQEWGLVNVIDKSVFEEDIAPISQIKILPFKEKDQWSLVAKYNIGKRR